MTLGDEVDPQTEMEAPVVEATLAPGGHSFTGLHTRLPNRHAVVGKRSRCHDERQQSNHNDALRHHLDAIRFRRARRSVRRGSIGWASVLSPERQADSDIVTVDLTANERELLAQGLLQWGGPAATTDALAVAMGFADVRDLCTESQRIGGAIRRGTPVMASDLRRPLVATEIAFSSDVFGAGVEWETVTGLTDQATISLLRTLQRKLVAVGRC